mmetsp:Transcript_75199/g.212541  ORF Transcript_75199/g.212541 Transcript_75199/m.212541 type:complete len:307 (+) Transcript_75199:200-1120(+)
MCGSRFQSHRRGCGSAGRGCRRKRRRHRGDRRQRHRLRQCRRGSVWMDRRHPEGEDLLVPGLLDVRRQAQTAAGVLGGAGCKAASAVRRAGCRGPRRHDLGPRRHVRRQGPRRRPDRAVLEAAVAAEAPSFVAEAPVGLRIVAPWGLASAPLLEHAHLLRDAAARGRVLHLLPVAAGARGAPRHEVAHGMSVAEPWGDWRRPAAADLRAGRARGGARRLRGPVAGRAGGGPRGRRLGLVRPGRRGVGTPACARVCWEAGCRADHGGLSLVLPDHVRAIRASTAGEQVRGRCAPAPLVGARQGSGVG